MLLPVVQADARRSPGTGATGRCSDPSASRRPSEMNGYSTRWPLVGGARDHANARGFAMFAESDATRFHIDQPKNETTAVWA